MRQKSLMNRQATRAVKENLKMARKSAILCNFFFWCCVSVFFILFYYVVLLFVIGLSNENIFENVSKWDYVILNLFGALDFRQMSFDFDIQRNQRYNLKIM